MKVSQLSTILGLIGSIVAATWLIDERYALSKELTSLEVRVKLNELQNLEHKIKEHIYFLKRQLRHYPDDIELKEELEEAKEELKELKRRKVKING